MNTTRPKYPPLNKADLPSSDSDLGKVKKISSGKAVKRVYTSPPKQISDFANAKLAKLQKKVDSKVSDEDSSDKNTIREDLPKHKNSEVQKGKPVITQIETIKRPTENKLYNDKQEKVLKDDSSVYTSSDSESETESISNVAIKKLQEENEALKKELEKQVKKIEEVTQINLKLQNQILSKFDAIDKNVEEFEKKAANSVGKETFAKVGTIKKDNIHLGQNIWLKKNKYDAVSISAKSAQTFINNLADACYGFNTLINSSVTGKVSNRTKKLNPQARPRLNPRIMFAIQESFEYWARSCTPSYDDMDIQFFRNNVPTILSKYITKLRERHCKKIVKNTRQEQEPPNNEGLQSDLDNQKNDDNQSNDPLSSGDPLSDLLDQEDIEDPLNIDEADNNVPQVTKEIEDSIDWNVRENGTHSTETILGLDNSDPLTIDEVEE